MKLRYRQNQSHSLRRRGPQRAKVCKALAIYSNVEAPHTVAGPLRVHTSEGPLSWLLFHPHYVLLDSQSNIHILHSQDSHNLFTKTCQPPSVLSMLSGTDITCSAYSFGLTIFCLSCIAGFGFRADFWEWALLNISLLSIRAEMCLQPNKHRNSSS